MKDLTQLELDTLRALPNTNGRISTAMREGKYTDSTSRNGTQIKRLRNLARERGYYTPERIERDEELTWKEAIKSKDLTNRVRLIEGRRKVAGMITDKQEINKTPDTIIIIDKSYRQSIEKHRQDAPGSTITDRVGIDVSLGEIAPQSSAKEHKQGKEGYCSKESNGLNVAMGEETPPPPLGDGI